MKLLLVGSTEVWSIENYYLKYLSEESFLELQIVSTSNFFRLHRSIVHRLIKRIFPNQNFFYTQFNRHLYQAVKAQKPDVILVFKGMEIYPETLKAIRNLGVKCCNYNPDHPFLFYSRGSGNKNVKQSVGFYDWHFAYSHAIIQEITARYQLPCTYLPFGYEIEDAIYKEASQQEELLKVGFIGNPDFIRVQHIQALLEAGIQVDVYGHGWEQYLATATSPNLCIFPAVYGDEFWYTAYRYRVQLNIFRPHNIGSHNMRTFEMPAVGAIMLAPDSLEHRSFFEHGKEAFFYQDIADMVKQARIILKLSKSEADQMRQQARNRSLRSGYSYKNCAQIVKTTLLQLLA